MFYANLTDSLKEMLCFFSYMSTIWRQSNKNPKIEFANAPEFISEGNIAKAIRDSYNEYIVKTNPKELPEKNGYIQTEWTENDEDNEATYKATYSDRYMWGVMKAPLGKRAQAQVQEAKQQTTFEEEAEEGEAEKPQFQKSTPKQEAVLVRISEQLETLNKYVEIIAQSFVDKGIQPASKLKQQE